MNPQHGHVPGLSPLEHVHPISPEYDSWQHHGGRGSYPANDPCLRDQGYYHHAPPYQPQENGEHCGTLDGRGRWPVCQRPKMQSIIADEQDAHTAATFVFDEDEYSSYDSFSNPIPAGRLRQCPPPQHRRQPPQGGGQPPQGGGHRYNFFLSPLRGSKKRQQSVAAAAAPTQSDLPTYRFPPQSQPQCHNENGREGGYVHRIHPFPTEKGLQTQDPRGPERHEQRGTGRQLEPLGEPNVSLHRDDGGTDDLSSTLPRTPRGSDSLPLPPLAGGRPRQVMGQYEILETLGKGMSGKVKKARHIQTGQEVALKIVDKSKVRGEEGGLKRPGETSREAAGLFHPTASPTLSYPGVRAPDEDGDSSVGFQGRGTRPSFFPSIGDCCVVVFGRSYPRAALFHGIYSIFSWGFLTSSFPFFSGKMSGCQTHASSASHRNHGLEDRAPSQRSGAFARGA